MVLPALSRPRRRTEYSVVARGDGQRGRIGGKEVDRLARRVLVTFFAGRVRIQRLGQVIHDRKIKTDATGIVEPGQSWEV